MAVTDRKQHRAKQALVGRRVAMKMAVSGLTAGLLFFVANPSRAQRKLTKQEAEYEDAPRDIRMCATCTLFLPPHACKVMEGEVKAEGWCKLFDLAD